MSSSSVTTRAPDASGPEVVREELRRIVSSPVFEDADRLVRFLTFVVEETLAGRAGSLKESLIGVAVFGREPGYDPKVDPIVRVQARRLRAKLDTYYAADQGRSVIHIELPKGGYTPLFGAPPHADVPAPVTAKPKFSLKLWLGVAGLVGVMGVVALLLVPKPKSTATGSRLFTTYPGYQTSPAFSPDGLTLAFSWGGPDGDNVDIYVQPLDADAPRRLTTSPQRERNPVWLPDGRHIGFVRDDAPDRFAVIVVPVIGAGEQRVAEIAGNAATPPRIEWSHDARRLYTSEPVAQGSTLQVVEINLDTGVHRGLVTSPAHGVPAGNLGDDEVSLSPDGKWIAFRRRTASVVGDFFVAPSAGGEAHAVTHDRTGVTGLAWTRDGSALIVSSQRQSTLVRLWRFPVNGDAPACLTDSILAASYPAVNPRDGQLAFASRFFDTNIWRVDLQSASPPQRLIASNLLDSSPRYSPSGDRIVFRSNRTGNDEIWTADAAGRSLLKLTNAGGPVTGSPHWSPDGRFVVYDSRPDGSADIFAIPAGGGRSRRLTNEPSNEVTPSFSADGRFVYFASDRSGAWNVWKQAIEGGTGALQITLNGGFAPQESSDGKWLYYAKFGLNGLFRVPVGGGSENTVLDSLPAGLWGGWSLAGNKVIYAAVSERGGDVPGELRIIDLDNGRARVLAALRFLPVQWDGSLGLSPDGRYALVSELERQGSEIHLQPEK